MERLVIALILAFVLVGSTTAATSATTVHNGMWNPVAHLDPSRIH